MHARSPFAVALVALLAGPAAAHAQSKAAAAPAKAAPATPTTTTAPGYAIGGWIGYEGGDLSGLQIRGDFIMPFQRLTPQIDLSFVGSIGYSYLTHSEFGVDTTGNVLKFVPAARFTYPVNPVISVYGDAGLGLYWSSVSFDYGGIIPNSSTSDVGFMLRFGLGGFYRLSPALQLGVSFYVDPMFGGYDDTTFSILGGVTYRL